MRLELLAHLGLQGDAGIEHDAQDADDFERGVEVGVNLLDGIDQVRQALEGEIFALHGHHHAVGTGQSVQGEQAEARGAIDEHKVVVGAGRGQRATQSLVATLQADQLDFGAGELAIGADDVVAGLLARLTRLCDGRVLEKDVVDAEVERALVDSRAHRRVALRVEVDDQHSPTELCKTGGEVHGRRRLAHATLLVGNAEDSHQVRVHWCECSLSW